MNKIEELERRNKELEALLKVLTHDISERITATDELISAKKEAEFTSQLKSEFVANMSHEIRTPLNGILSALSLLSDTKLTDEQHKLLRVMQLSGDTLLRQVNDILDFSKISEGKLEIYDTPFDLSKLVSEICDVYKFSAERKGLSFECFFEVPYELRHLIGDSPRIQQVLENLLSNAIKFTPEGTVRFIINAQVCTDGLLIDFTVEDTGVGISLDKVSSLFEPFFQEDASSSKRFSGSGLGLSICQRLASLMNGHIRFDESYTDGCRVSFIVTLPQGKLSKLRSDTPSILTQFDSLSVLLAEDNTINQVVIKRMLEKLGCVVHCSCNGQEAIDLFFKNSYDVVFMDCQMPDIDGCDVTSIIRSRESGAKQPVPIIALTAYATVEQRERCLNVGMDQFLTKPVQIQQLSDVLLSLNLAVRSSPQVEQQA